MPSSNSQQPTVRRYRPRTVVVFAAAFVAGAAAAVGVNRALDVHLAQARPQIEAEPIFVALRTLPQGSPVTVWDVALRDWPKAMLPSAALRAHDSFEGQVLRYPLREGQPLLSVQLVPAERDSTAPHPSRATEPAFVPAEPAAPKTSAALTADPWMPAEPVASPRAPARAAEIVAMQPPATVVSIRTGVADGSPVAETPVAETPVAETPVAETPVAETPVAETPVAETPVAETPVAETPVAEPEAPVEQLAEVGGDSDHAAGDTTAETAPAPTGSERHEPTLADAFAGGITAKPSANVLAAPAELPASQSVLNQEESAREEPRPSAAPDLQATRRRSPRYLVVPERVAEQADRSFAGPRPAPESQSVAAAEAEEPLNKVVPIPNLQQIQEAQQPGSTQAQGPGSQPPARTAQGAATMFPNIAAGIDALTAGMRRPTRPQPQQTQPQVQAQPQQSQRQPQAPQRPQPSQRPARGGVKQVPTVR